MMQDVDLTSLDAVYQLAFAHDFAHSGVCFAAKRSGLYRSADSGQTWTSAYESLQLSEPLLTTAVAAAPDYPLDPLLLAAVKGGLLYTEDGQKWHALLFQQPPPVITSLAFSPNFASDRRIVAGTAEDGVVVSEDRGQTWSAWNFGLLDLNTHSIAFSPNFADDETLYVGVESGIFRSVNGGRAWRLLPFPFDDQPVISLAVTDTHIFAGTQSAGLWVSTDDGQTWTRCDEAALPDVVNAVIVAGSQVVALRDDALVVSIDGGQTWGVWAMLRAPSACAALSPDGGTLLVGTAAGDVLRFSREV